MTLYSDIYYFIARSNINGLLNFIEENNINKDDVKNVIYSNSYDFIIERELLPMISKKSSFKEIEDLLGICKFPFGCDQLIDNHRNDCLEYHLRPLNSENYKTFLEIIRGYYMKAIRIKNFNAIIILFDIDIRKSDEILISILESFKVNKNFEFEDEMFEKFMDFIEYLKNDEKSFKNKNFLYNICDDKMKNRNIYINESKWISIKSEIINTLDTIFNQYNSLVMVLKNSSNNDLMTLKNAVNEHISLLRIFMYDINLLSSFMEQNLSNDKIKFILNIYEAMSKNNDDITKILGNKESYIEIKILNNKSKDYKSYIEIENLNYHFQDSIISFSNDTMYLSQTFPIYPMIYALSKNNFEIADILKEKGAYFNDSIFYDLIKADSLNIENLKYIFSSGIEINSYSRSQFYRWAVENENNGFLFILIENDDRLEDEIFANIYSAFFYVYGDDENSKYYHKSMNNLINEKLQLSDEDDPKVKRIKKRMLNYFKKFDIISARGIKEIQKKIIKICHSNDLDQLKTYIENNYIEIHELSYESFDILKYLIENKKEISLAIIEYIINLYDNLNYSFSKKDDMRPIYLALYYNKFDIANILLKHGAGINYKIKNENIIEYLYHKSHLNCENLEYIFKNGFIPSDSMINDWIKNYENVMLYLFLKYNNNNNKIKEYHYLNYKNAAKTGNIGAILILILWEKKNINEIIYRIFYSRDIPETYMPYKNLPPAEMFDINTILSYDIFKSKNNGIRIEITQEIFNEISDKLLSIKDKILNEIKSLTKLLEKRKEIITLLDGGNKNKFKYIKENNINLSQFKNYDFDILIYAISNHYSNDDIEFIINCGYDTLNYCIKTFCLEYKYECELIYITPLSLAISQSKFEIADLLLNCGSDINDDVFQSIWDNITDKTDYIHWKIDEIFLYLLKNGYNVRNETSVDRMVKIFTSDSNFLYRYLELYLKFFTEKKEKIIIKDEYYEYAIDKRNYGAFIVLLDYDRREIDQLISFIKKFETSTTFGRNNEETELKSFNNELYNMRFFGNTSMNSFRFSSRNDDHRLDIINEYKLLNRERYNNLIKKINNCYEKFSIWEKKVIEYLNVNKINKEFFENFLKKNQIELKKLKRYFDFDLLIYAIENNVSKELIEFIIKECQYKTVNYKYIYQYQFRKLYKTPLLAAIGKDNYKLANWLINEKKANINYEKSNEDLPDDSIPSYIYKEGILNEKKLEYMLNKGYNKYTNLLKYYILNDYNTDRTSNYDKYINEFITIKKCIDRIFYNNEFIQSMLYYYKNKIKISDKQLQEQIKNNKLIKELYDFVIENLNRHNRDTVIYLLRYESDRKQKEIIIKKYSSLYNEDDQYDDPYYDDYYDDYYDNDYEYNDWIFRTTINNIINDII